MGEISIQRMVPAGGIPAPASLRSWAQAALGRQRGELNIRIVGDDESRTLNRQYRGKDKPTNVLSFQGGDALTPPSAPRTVPPSPASRARDVSAAFGRMHVLLGDLVICAPVVAREAAEQGKTARAHWAHMVVHGCLHLLGHDHEVESEALRMEALEIRILKRLGFSNPYER